MRKASRALPLLEARFIGCLWGRGESRTTEAEGADSPHAGGWRDPKRGRELGSHGRIGQDITKYFLAPVLGTPTGEAWPGRQEACLVL